MARQPVIDPKSVYGEHFEEYLMAVLRNEDPGAGREMFQLWLHGPFYCLHCDRLFGPDPTTVSEEDEIRCPACAR